MERYQTNDLRLHHILLEKQEQAKHKTSRRWKKKKRAEIVELETAQTT
jgi:hypothetical protein